MRFEIHLPDQEGEGAWFSGTLTMSLRVQEQLTVRIFKRSLLRCYPDSSEESTKSDLSMLAKDGAKIANSEPKQDPSSLKTLVSLSLQTPFCPFSQAILVFWRL